MDCILHDEPHPLLFNGYVMELSLVLLCLQSLLLSSVDADPSGSKCPPASGRGETCVCQADGGIIDRTPFSNTDGTPRYLYTTYSLCRYLYIACMYRYADLPDAKKQYTYSYNPCSAYHDPQNKGDCDNIYVRLSYHLYLDKIDSGRH